MDGCEHCAAKKEALKGFAFMALKTHVSFFDVMVDRFRAQDELLQRLLETNPYV